MTNLQKFTNPAELEQAYVAYCHEKYAGKESGSVPSQILLMAEWLMQEAKIEPPEDCPFCGQRVLVERMNGDWRVTCSRCAYVSQAFKYRDEAIHKHNRIATAAQQENLSDRLKKSETLLRNAESALDAISRLDTFPRGRGLFDTTLKHVREYETFRDSYNAAERMMHHGRES